MELRILFGHVEHLEIIILEFVQSLERIVELTL